MKRDLQPAPPYRPDFRLYELLKRDWIARNPTATPEEYQQAMQRIAQRAGI
jgi:hypothetical protein